jgi:hypothetical protein
VALPFEKLCEKRAGGPGPENENAHGVAKTLPHSARRPRRGRKRRGRQLRQLRKIAP